MKTDGIQIRILDILFILKKRWKTIVISTVMGLIFGLLLSAMSYMQSSFQSFDVAGTVTISAINEKGTFTQGPNATNNDYHLAEDMVDAVKYIMTSDKVLGDVITTLNLRGYTVSDLKNILSITQHQATQILNVNLTWSTAETGTAIWNAIIDETNVQLPIALQLGKLIVLNEPTAKLIGLGLVGNMKSAFILAAAGLFVGIGLAVMELLLRPTINNVKDVETMFGLEILSTIPKSGNYGKDSGPVLAKEGYAPSKIIQAYSVATYVLQNRLGKKEAHHCIYVTSTTSAEGKTSAAASIAYQLAEMEHSTLLIDFNTHSPAISQLFLGEMDYMHSINAIYRGDATEEEAIANVGPYLDVLPLVMEHTMINMDNSFEILLNGFKEKYEYVIIDTSPIGEEAEALSLNAVADAVLFVVGYDHAILPDLKNAILKLDKTGMRIIGSIVNCVPDDSEKKIKQPTEKKNTGKKVVPAKNSEYVSNESMKNISNILAGTNKTDTEDQGIFESLYTKK